MDENSLDKLRDKIESRKKEKKLPFYFPAEQINIKHKHKNLTSEAKIFNLIKELEFLKKLLGMIEKGATGFELAHSVQKYKKIKIFIHNGINFYNTFNEIGELIFLEAPDKKEKDYSFFKTVEDTEKFIFMVWIKDAIDKVGEYLKNNVESPTLKKLREKIIKQTKYCSKCDAEIMDDYQKICEKCGEDIKIEW
ncbi:MAG: hypothetical protein EU529_13705 [Promethearchaeota archaeon]|nr:MAG: hypothetical protein EU529_13705 [Candidatus Lokiarchaeota archaeon]